MSDSVILNHPRDNVNAARNPSVLLTGGKILSEEPLSHDDTALGVVLNKSTVVLLSNVSGK